MSTGETVGGVGDATADLERGELVAEDPSAPDGEGWHIPEVGPLTEVDFDEVVEHTLRPPAWDAPPSIVVTDACKWYDNRNRGRLRAALPVRPSTTPPPGAVVALDGASLAIGDGQSVGIIGNNGAGKSTLLKLIAGVTAPSRGEVRVAGRVASMIELGLGFNPEMTGTENLRFSAGLLGMSRRTLATRWDDIVGFSGVEHALDKPTKTYSSGMLARLGFALASHSDAEVILVDEVLSVGDFDFQRRSLERIMKLNREGRTTVIVTHNLDALPPLCHRIVQLEKGRVVADGTPAEVIPGYVLKEQRKYAARADNAVRLYDLEVTPHAIQPSDPIRVQGVVEVLEPMPGCKLMVRFGFGDALRAFAADAEINVERIGSEEVDLRLDRPGRWKVDVTVVSVPLFPGDYSVGLSVVETDDELTELVHLVAPLDVLGARDKYMGLRVRLDQRIEPLGPAAEAAIGPTDPDERA